MTNAPPTELLIARHGEAHCNTHQIVGGPLGCTGLTNTGRHQVQQLATRLRQHEHAQRPITRLYTTPLPRTRQSAAIIAKHLDLTPTVEPALAETHYGTADGKPWAEVVHTFAGIPAQQPDRPLAPGAETWTHYLQRATTALAAIIDEHAGQRLLIVGHGDTVTAAAHLVLRLSAATLAKAAFAAHPASLTHWAQQPLSWTQPHTGQRWTLLHHNDTRHLCAPHDRTTALPNKEHRFA